MWDLNERGIAGRRVLAAAVIALVVAAASCGAAPLAEQGAPAGSHLVVAALRVLEQHYVEPVDPAVLLNAAILNLRRYTRLDAQSLPQIPSASSEPEAVFLFQRAFARAAWSGRMPVGPLAYTTTQHMLAALHDTHVFYLEPARFNETERQLAGQSGYEGVGVLFTYQRTPGGGGEIFVREVVPGSPAAIAGLRKFDRILDVNRIPVSRIPSQTTATLVRGPAGSLVDLDILRGHQKFTAILRRSPIVITPAYAQSIGPGIAYVRIIEFGEGTAAHLRRAIETVQAHDAVHAVILDLRWNHGGFIEEAESVAGIFLPPKTALGRIVRRNESLKILRAKGTPILLWPKLIVLTNGGTASSSEVIASGLLDSRRATLVGERTAGAVGLARAVLLSAGGMGVTVYRITGPKFERLDGVGITPGVPVPFTAADMEHGLDPQLQVALRLSAPGPQPGL